MGTNVDLPKLGSEKLALISDYLERISALTIGRRSAARQRVWYGVAIAASVLLLFISLAPQTRWGLLAALPAAAAAIRGYRHAHRRAGAQYRLRKAYEKGIARLKHDWDSLETGEEYRDPTHLFAADLDLFGRGSLYAVLCSARTRAGKDVLARWMLEPADPEEAARRSDAVRELQNRKDISEAIASVGPAAVADCTVDTFRKWVEWVPAPFPPWARVSGFLLALVVPGVALTAWLGNSPQLLSTPLFAAAIALEVAFSLVFRKRVRAVLECLGVPTVELPVLRAVAKILTVERFKSSKLARLSDCMGRDRDSARRELMYLTWMVRLLEQRDNPMFMLPSYVLLWGTQFAFAIDRWRRRHSTRVLEWLSAIGEFDALISVATYATEHPRDPYPEFVAGGPLLEVRRIGHPLLDDAGCVRNDLRLDTSEPLVIISGSNMSGKSTLLRAVGVNLVLARLGAPVRCERMLLSDLSLGASILVSDSLVEGRSHFMTEVDRLRRIIDAAGRRPLLFLIDEILIGTNSHDRRIVAEWVVRALIARGALGCITTHDLALTDIAAGDGLSGRNFHFADLGDSSGLSFDYLLKPGVVQGSNALQIVRSLGIGMDDSFVRVE